MNVSPHTLRMTGCCLTAASEQISVRSGVTAIM